MNSDVKTQKTITVIISSHIEFVSPLRIFIRNLLDGENWNPENIDNVEIGFDETITNVIKHTYSYNLEYKVVIEIFLSSKEAVIDIKDKGKPFNPTLLVIPQIKDQIKLHHERFFGTSLIRKCLDKVEYFSSSEFSNILRLTKYNRYPDSA